MSDLQPRGDVTKRDLTRGTRLKAAAIAAPVVLTSAPAILFTVLFILFGSAPPAAVSIFFLGMLLTILGFALGLGLSGFFTYRYSNWKQELRERMAARGIRAEEVDWFRKELKTSERQTLKLIAGRDPLLADAYRETLASRLTATRIVKMSKKELLLMQRRQNKLRYYKTESSQKFLKELDTDIAKIKSINQDAKEMLTEAEARLQMIDVASLRGSSIADSELALKKLSARASELPLALENAKLTEEIRQELEKETEEAEETLELPEEEK
jgi:hypothetical protein